MSRSSERGFPTFQHRAAFSYNSYCELNKVVSFKIRWPYWKTQGSACNPLVLWGYFPRAGFLFPIRHIATYAAPAVYLPLAWIYSSGLSLYTVVFPPDYTTTSVAMQERYRICELSNRINRRAPMDDKILKNPELLKMQIELEESNYRYAFELQKDIGLLLRIKHHIRYLKETLERLNTRTSSLSKKQTPPS